MRIINTHAHWYPPEWVQLLEQEGNDNGAVIGKNARGEVTFNKAGTQFRGVEERGNIAFRRDQIDIEQRLRNMDDTRVDVQVLSLTTPMVYWAPAEFGLRLSQAFNNACAAVHRQYPDRFLGMAMLPMQAPALAVQELERAATLPGLCGVYMATHINGKNLDEKEFFPVYEKCEALNWPIFLHPGNPVGGERIKKHFLVNLLGNPYDTGIAAASLMFGGVLDAFPNLDIMLPHAGGSFPALIGRMEHGASMRPELKHMTKPPSHYLRRFHYDTIAHNSHFLMYMIQEIGADRIVLGDDYPADMGYKRPVDVIDALSELSTEQRDLILSRNAERLLRLERLTAH